MEILLSIDPKDDVLPLKPRRKMVQKAGPVTEIGEAKRPSTHCDAESTAGEDEKIIQATFLNEFS